MNQTKNKPNCALVVLAAGLGNRFGGLKQLTPISRFGNTILDYSIYDALAMGIQQVVFVVSKETKALFVSKYQHLSNEIRVNYVIQDTSKVPQAFAGVLRLKPWGTGHALLMANSILDTGPFIVINADDFYGRDAYVKAKDMLSDINEARYGTVVYTLSNTLSDNGAVSRGACTILNNQLQQVVERTEISRQDNAIVYKENDLYFEMKATTKVSMNFWILHTSMMHHLKTAFQDFLNRYNQEETTEFFLPQVLNQLIKSEQVTIKTATTKSQWFGVTYADDLVSSKQLIEDLETTGIYPQQLWKS